MLIKIKGEIILRRVSASKISASYSGALIDSASSLSSKPCLKLHTFPLSHPPIL